MFELYTIRKLRVEYIPYAAYTVSSNNDVQTCIWKPTFSVMDNDNAGPVNINEYLAHSITNRVVQNEDGNKRHVRSIDNPQKLLHIIENKQYFDTNG